MSNQSEDIQVVGYDTHPPMLNITYFESWQQQIRLYCKGKDHGEYILQSINEGPFKMGWCRDEIALGTDGLYLGLERDRVVVDLSQVPLQPSYIPPVTYQPQFTDNTHLDTEEGPVQDMAQNEDNIFQADQCDAFNFDADEAPTAQTMFMANLSSADLFYDEAGPSYNLTHSLRVAISYKNPFYLSKAKKIQPALYNGHEIVNTNNARALVHDSEDTLEIAETTRKEMLEIIKDPECVKKKFKIAPHDYSKNNYLVTFTPQKQLTFEQIFWSDDLLKMKFEGIQKALVNKSKEMKKVFCQMEAEVDQHVVDKKCDEIERKNILIKNENLIVECLSKDVFYTATEYVLTVSRFSNMHDAYTVVQKRIAELEAENSNLTQKIQKDDHDEMIIHFSQLEVEHLNLQLNYQHLKGHFGNKKSVTSSDALAFEVENKKVKLHYKELYDSIKLTSAKTIEKTTSLLTEINTLKAQIKGKTNCVIMPDHMKPKVLTHGMYAIDVEQIPPGNRNNKEVHLYYLKHLKESVETLREIVEEDRAKKPLDISLASAYLYTKHS
nr:integrase, catalytic region, zinc finger, CCHC-type, peptidase aspartic, catalytic [Tanacetum cinerariifolium]